MTNRLFFVLLCAASLLLFPVRFSAAAIEDWTGGGGNGNFGNNGNWLDGSAPAVSAPADSIRWDTSATAQFTVTNGNARSYYSIIIGSPGNNVTIDNNASGSLTLGAGGIDMSAATKNLSHTGSNNLTLGADQEWTITNTGTFTTGRPIVTGGFALTVNNTAAVTLSNAISGTGSLTKNGGGTLTLGATAGSTYSGNTLISNGTLTVGDVNVLPFGAGKGNVTIDSPGVLNLNLGGVNVNGLSGTGTVRITGGTNRSLIVGNNNATGFTFSGTLEDTGTGDLNFQKVGTGTFTLGASGTYTNAGTTTISGGTMNFNGTHVLAAAFASDTANSVININGTVTANSTFNVANGDSITSTVNVNNGGTLTLAGSSALIGQNANGAVGNLNVLSGGSLIVTTADFRVGNGANGTTGVLTLNAGGQITMNASANSFAIGNATNGGANGVSGTFNLDGGTLTTSRNIRNGTFANDATTSIFNFNGGTLKAGASFTVFNDITSANVRDGGAIFDTNGATNTITVAEPLLHSTIGGDAATDGGLTKLNSAGTLRLEGLNTYNGGTIVNGGTLTLAASSGSTGAIRGDLTINSGGTVSLDPAHSWALGWGGSSVSVTNMLINGGIMDFTGVAAGSGGFAGDTITMTGGSIQGGVFDWYNGTTTTPTLTMSSGATISSGMNLRLTGAGVLTIDVSDSGTISGAIQNNVAGNAGGNITKTGVGTLTLSGASSSYAGSTTISQGTVQVQTSVSALGIGTVTLNDANTGANNTALLANSGLNAVANNISVANFGSGTTTIGSTTTNTALVVYSGSLTLAKNVTLQGTSAGAFSTRFTGQITGTGDILVTSGLGGAVVFARPSIGPANNFTGDITLATNSILQLGNGGSGDNDVDLPSNTSVSFNTGSQMVMMMGVGSGLETMGTLKSLSSGAGTVNLSAGSGFDLTIGADDDSGTFSGAIQNTSGSLSLTKTGTGTQELTGANTYSGATTVSGGILALGTDGSIGGTTEVNIGVGTAGEMELNNGNHTTAIDLSDNDVNVGVSATGVLDANAGAYNIDGNLDVGIGATGTVTVDNSTLDIDGQLRIGGNATGGTAGTVGTLTIGPGGFVNVNSNTTIVDGGPGTLIIGGLGFADVGSLIVGSAATGIVTHTTGTASINSDLDASATGNLILAQTAGTGTYDLSGGTLFVHGNGTSTSSTVYGNTSIGGDTGVGGGVGEFNHIGGTFYNDTNMYVGGAAAGSAYNLPLLSTGVLDFRDRLDDGTQAVATDSAVSSLLINSTGAFNFNAGTLMNVTTIDPDTTSTGGTFTQNGGLFVIGVDGGLNSSAVRALTTISGDYTLGADATLAVDLFGPDVRSKGGEAVVGSHGNFDPVLGTGGTDLFYITDSDLLEVLGDVSLSGTLAIDTNGASVTPWGWYDVIVADSFTISPSFTLTGVPLWRVIDDLSPGNAGRQIFQVGVPEPASLALWGLVILAGLACQSFYCRKR